MSLLERVRETSQTEERMVWECNDCGETFGTSVPADAETPNAAPCESCDSMDVRIIDRAYG